MTTKAVIVIFALPLTLNVTFCAVLLNRSKTLMKTLINVRMLDISNTAAAMVNGDVAC